MIDCLFGYSGEVSSAVGWLVLSPRRRISVSAVGGVATRIATVSSNNRLYPRPARSQLPDESFCHLGLAFLLQLLVTPARSLILPNGLTKPSQACLAHLVA